MITNIWQKPYQKIGLPGGVACSQRASSAHRLRNDPFSGPISGKRGHAVKIDQGDLLWGMSMIFVKEFMDNTIKESFEKGEIIFREGDRADYFYTLIAGHVQLAIGGVEKEVYTVNRAGEGFGWSSLLDRNYYSASAKCMETTVLLKLERGRLNKLLEKSPENGFIFYKRLSGILGNRLVQCYRLVYPEEAYRAASAS